MSKAPILIAAMVAATVVTTTVRAQISEADALAAIESNNPTLRAVRLETEAEKAATAADGKMPDLEVEVGYLWPGRKDFSVSQPIDWSVVSRQKRKTAAARDTLAAASYAAARQEVLLEARLAWIDATYQAALMKVRSRHAEAIGQIALVVQRRLDAGDARQMDANAATLAYAATMRQLTLASADRNAALLRLKALNGGKEIAHAEVAFAPVRMPSDFETWYAQHARRTPSLMATSAQSNVAQNESREMRMATAPQMTVGFAGEFTDDEKFKGVTVAVSLPLWRGRTSRNAAALAAEAAESRHQAACANDRAEAEAAWERTVRLRQAAQEFRVAIGRTDNTDLLTKALNAGEASVTEALEASATFYAAEEEALAAERDFHEALARLMASDL